MKRRKILLVVGGVLVLILAISLIAHLQIPERKIPDFQAPPGYRWERCSSVPEGKNVIYNDGYWCLVGPFNSTEEP